MKNPAKERYNELRRRPWQELWEEEVPRFDKAEPRERLQTVALIRAVAVVFAETGPAEERENVKRWLAALLRDPEEKIRRYAMNALPKIGAGADEEAALLGLLRSTGSDREKKFVGRALDKIGGEATLEVLGRSQKVRAGVIREQNPGAVVMDRALTEFAGLRVHLRGRRGLEEIVRDEAQEALAGHFRVVETAPGRVTVMAAAPFSLGDLYALRCFGSVGFELGFGRGLDALADVIASPLSRRLFEAFTDGPPRYRLDFVGEGHRRGAVRELAERVFARRPEILNDPHRAPWSVNLCETGRGTLAELSPRLVPDPRFAYRLSGVPAASHPPLAACMARLAGPGTDEVVFDPFCGSGLELVERALRGGVRALYGSDLSGEAIAASRGNLAAANVAVPEIRLEQGDFRDFAAALEPGSVSLVVSNPPMGRRVPIADLNGLIGDLVSVAARVLAPGGRLVFANPLPHGFAHPKLKLVSSRQVDFGAFFTRLELYQKTHVPRH